MGHTFNQMVCCHRAVPDKKLISGSDVWHVLRKQLCHLISFWAWVLLLMQQESWNELLVVLSDRFCTHWQSLVLTCTLICEDKTAWPLGCCHFQHSSDRSWKIGLWKKNHPFFRCPGSRPTVATALSKMATPRCLEHLNSRYFFLTDEKFLGLALSQPKKRIEVDSIMEYSLYWLTVFWWNSFKVSVVTTSGNCIVSLH